METTEEPEGQVWQMDAEDTLDENSGLSKAVNNESAVSTSGACMIDVFDSDDDKFLGEIPEDEFCIDTLSTSTLASSAIPNEAALKWLEKMRLAEEGQLKIFRTLKRFSPTDKIFPDVRISNFHTVAFKVKHDYQPGNYLMPYPRKFTSNWNDSLFVPIPCCPENIRRVRGDISVTISNEDEYDGQADEKRNVVEEKFKEILIWERLTNALERSSFSSCHDIYLAMKHYLGSSTRGPLNVLQFAIDTLMSAEERVNFFSKVLPCIAKMCLDLPNVVTSPLPLLTRFKNYSISLSQVQIACLLANAFFSTFPKRGPAEYNYGSINFNELFSSNPDDERFSCRANKVRCILHYFERLENELPSGVVTFTRKSIQKSKMPDWKMSTKKLGRMVVLSKGTIETEGAGTLQVDFANRYIGGGVLGDGAVQEEILFVIYPEMLVARLFTENFASSEALLITGCERFSTYFGYSRSFTYAGDYEDCTPWDLKGRKCTQMVAIDALFVRDRIEQFQPRNILRELNKAYVGFSSPSPLPVAISTGKWGCGAFNGDPELKAVIQLLAASQAGRDLTFFTFGDTHMQDTVLAIIEVIKDKSIQVVWKLLTQYYSLFCSNGKPRLGLAGFFMQCGNSDVQEVSEPSNKHIKLTQLSVAQFYPKS